MIDIQGLEKKFNDRAIFSGLNLKLEKGKVYALIGKSGSGKTTLLNILGKLEKIDGGRVLYQGKDLKTIPIRVHGYLLDFASIEGQRQKHYRLKNLPQTVELTVDDVEEDVDLTLPENRSYQEADFFERMFRENC
ncbi:TPA: ATP-binding cassette domain-containing protein [Streptococcus pneumoniae]|nr:ATP-binding cassette domain-containing protein [Streptococcus pneumoniae]HEV1528604.1 ATP-binding cassette domain-containing protein [Streptococcus pneumoniae]